jgi:hypothetical protein
MVFLCDQGGTIARLASLRTCIVVTRLDREISRNPDSLSRTNEVNPYTVLGNALIRI